MKPGHLKLPLLSIAFFFFFPERDVFSYKLSTSEFMTI